MQAAEQAEPAQTRAQSKVALMHSSNASDWCTPVEVLNLACAVMGGIDLDPASSALANQRVRADVFYDEKDDGLNQEWHGRVWLNPPYGKVNGISGARVWSENIIERYRNREIDQGMLLVNASIGERWFRPLWDFPILFFHRRLRFDRPDGTKGPSPTKGNALVYFGRHSATFARMGAAHGRVVLP